MEPIRFTFPAVAGGYGALAVSANACDLRNLARLFAHSGLRLNGEGTVEAALANLEGVSVVICDELLPDGGWERIAEAAAAMERPPSIIVVSRRADEQLWSDVLNRGAFDLLPRPFSTSELYRVVVGAWRAWNLRAQARVAGAA